MKKIEVIYSGGMSAYEPNGAVDYMLAQNPDWDHDLYAEYPVQDDENENYDLLKADILAQAKSQGIPAESLHFWFDGEKRGNHMTSLTINQHYILAGSFPSVWQCLTFGGGHIFNDHVAVMRNVNTKEIRICKNPEVNDDGTVQWSSSTDDNHSFSIKTYRMDGYAKEAIEDLDWQEMLDIWADEESQGYPEPTIWIGETRLVDGPILLEAYED